MSDEDLIEVPDNASRDAGFIAPVLITRTVWDDCVAWDDTDHERTGVIQDEDGRLWDVLHMAANAVRTMPARHGDSWEEALFQVWRVARDAEPGEDGDIEPTPIYLSARRTDEGIEISRAAES
ncbi:DUF6573 family protein [Actinomadura litoris]|uniref:DUF6573 family protein n=1 Tax=Actinomadura litoris TaxID=2678616 RepID=UPI001FA77E2B|nr:DUF6573 family protein [Actinomadura litoris]